MLPSACRSLSWTEGETDMGYCPSQHPSTLGMRSAVSDDHLVDIEKQKHFHTNVSSFSRWGCPSSCRGSVFHSTVFDLPSQKSSPGSCSTKKGALHLVRPCPAGAKSSCLVSDEDVESGLSMCESCSPLRPVIPCPLSLPATVGLETVVNKRACLGTACKKCVCLETSFERCVCLKTGVQERMSGNLQNITKQTEELQTFNLLAGRDLFTAEDPSNPSEQSAEPYSVPALPPQQLACSLRDPHLTLDWIMNSDRQLACPSAQDWTFGSMKSDAPIYRGAAHSVLGLTATSPVLDCKSYYAPSGSTMRHGASTSESSGPVDAAGSIERGKQSSALCCLLCNSRSDATNCRENPFSTSDGVKRSTSQTTVGRSSSSSTNYLPDLTANEKQNGLTSANPGSGSTALAAVLGNRSASFPLSDLAVLASASGLTSSVPKRRNQLLSRSISSPLAEAGVRSPPFQKQDPVESACASAQFQMAPLARNLTPSGMESTDSWMQCSVPGSVLSPSIHPAPSSAPGLDSVSVLAHRNQSGSFSVSSSKSAAERSTPVLQHSSQRNWYPCWNVSGPPTLSGSSGNRLSNNSFCNNTASSDSDSSNSSVINNTVSSNSDTSNSSVINLSSASQRLELPSSSSSSCCSRSPSSSSTDSVDSGMWSLDPHVATSPLDSPLPHGDVPRESSGGELTLYGSTPMTLKGSRFIFGQPASAAFSSLPHGLSSWKQPVGRSSTRVAVLQAPVLKQPADGTPTIVSNSTLPASAFVTSHLSSSVSRGTGDTLFEGMPQTSTGAGPPLTDCQNIMVTSLPHLFFVGESAAGGSVPVSSSSSSSSSSSFSSSTSMVPAAADSIPSTSLVPGESALFLSSPSSTSSSSPSFPSTTTTTTTSTSSSSYSSTTTTITTTISSSSTSSSSVTSSSGPTLAGDQTCDECLKDFDRLQRSMKALSDACFYYPELDSDGARTLLQDTPLGTFLVRGSSDNHFLFAITLKTERGPTSVRVRYEQGLFQMDCENRAKSALPRFETILDLLDFHVTVSRQQQGFQYRWLEASRRRDLPVRLASAWRHSPPSLTHLARVTVNRSLEDLHLPARSTNLLPIPDSVKQFMREYPYRV